MANVRTGNPKDFAEVVNNLPKVWFRNKRDQALYRILIGRALDDGRVVVARGRRGKLLGALLWEDTVSFDSLYVRFSYASVPKRAGPISLQMFTHLEGIAKGNGLRSILAEVPSGSRQHALILRQRRAKEVGRLVDVHGPGTRTHVFKFDV